MNHMTTEHTPETEALNKAHADSASADAAGMGTEIPCEQAYGEMFDLASKLERQRDELAEALRKCEHAISSYLDGLPIDEWRMVRDHARAALAKLS